MNDTKRRYIPKRRWTERVKKLFELERGCLSFQKSIRRARDRIEGEKIGEILLPVNALAIH